MKNGIALTLVLTLASACHLPGLPGLPGRRPSSAPRPPSPRVFPAGVPSPGFVAPGMPVPSVHPTNPGARRRWTSPFYRPSPVHLPGPISTRARHAPYFPFYWYYNPVVRASTVEVTVPDYEAPASLGLRFGDPTIGTDEDVLGEWVLDPRRSAAVMEAWLRHIMRAHGSTEDPDLSKLESEFRELDARLSVGAGGSYVLRLNPKNEDGPIEWEGTWGFDEGVLDLTYAEDVDGVPMESGAVYEFNYYRNDKFVGLVVVNHGLGLVMTRPE